MPVASHEHDFHKFAWDVEIRSDRLFPLHFKLSPQNEPGRMGIGDIDHVTIACRLAIDNLALGFGQPYLDGAGEGIANRFAPFVLSGLDIAWKINWRCCHCYKSKMDF